MGYSFGGNMGVEKRNSINFVFNLAVVLDKFCFCTTKDQLSAA